MKKPDIPDNEKTRIKDLDKCNILYTPSEERFDRITRLAYRIFDVPIALISIVGSEIQWFKSRQGITSSETSREISFCGHAILRNDTFIIPDTHLHLDFSDNPLVINPPNIRFYAGQPLTYGSSRLGTLCIIDKKPRNLSYTDIDSLKSLAKWVENELKLNLYNKSQNDLIKRLKAVKRKLLIDPLLGTWNQEGINALLTRDVSKRIDNDTNISLIMVHLRGLKKIAKEQEIDIYEDLLSEIVQRIRSSVRPSDVVGRTDDGEFNIILDECGCRNVITCGTVYPNL